MVNCPGKYILILLFFFQANASNAQVQKVQDTKYVLIRLVEKFDGNKEPYETGEPNKDDINKLSEPLRGLAAYYTFNIQCDCDYYDTTGNVTCGLTIALGLGRQGSDKQVAMLKKWFPNDDDAKWAIDNNCSVGVPGSSDFLEYQSLIFTVRHDTVTVTEDYIHYSHGDIDTLTQTNKAVIKDDKITFIKK